VSRPILASCRCSAGRSDEGCRATACSRSQAHDDPTGTTLASRERLRYRATNMVQQGESLSVLLAEQEEST
jgi:hypothetical protein